MPLTHDLVWTSGEVPHRLHVLRVQGLEFRLGPLHSKFALADFSASKLPVVPTVL